MQWLKDNALTVTLIVIPLITQWAIMNYRLDSLEREQLRAHQALEERMQTLEQKNVTRQELYDVVVSRMDRLENKIDRIGENKLK
jgi:hypothetical protein